MIRSNVVNYLNRGVEFISINKQTAWKFNVRNGVMYMFSPLEKYFDELNNTNSFYLFFKQSNNLPNFCEKTIHTNWTRVAFRGKSYRIKCFSKLNKFTFNFGYSHWTKFIANKLWTLHRRRRQSYLVFTYNLQDMQFFKRKLPYVRFYNCYTMRGLRLKKQPIIRRFGKISQHISILH